MRLMNRTSPLILITTLALSSALTGETVSNESCHLVLVRAGDVNLDGEVNVDDAMDIFHMAEIEADEALSFFDDSSFTLTADVDGDLQVTEEDGFLALDLALGHRDGFPVPEFVLTRAPRNMANSVPVRAGLTIFTLETMAGIGPDAVFRSRSDGALEYWLDHSSPKAWDSPVDGSAFGLRIISATATSGSVCEVRQCTVAEVSGFGDYSRWFLSGSGVGYSLMDAAGNLTWIDTPWALTAQIEKGPAWDYN